MRLRTFLLVALLLAGAAVTAQERVDLTVAETKPVNASYHVGQILLDVDGLSISVTLRGANGETKTAVYNSASTPSGATLLTSLNRGNFTVNSLMRAIYTRLLADGVITGTIAGTPQ